MVGLNDGEKILKICNHLDTISAFDRRMDRETDRQSSCDSIVRAMQLQARRAVKFVEVCRKVGLYRAYELPKHCKAATIPESELK